MSFMTCFMNKFKCSEQKRIDLTGIKYEKIYSSDVKTMLKAEILAAGIAEDRIADEWNNYDSEYLAWPTETINEVYKLIPEKYSHVDWLTGIFDKPGQGADCDNSAGWRKQWFYNYLPGCAAIGISGFHSKGGHRWCGLVSTEGNIVWFGGTLSKYNRISDIVW